MRLATKILSVILVVIVVLLATYGYFSVQREVNLFEKDMKRNALLLGHALKGIISDVWQTSGQKRVLELIEDANKEEELLKIRWVWLDASPGEPNAPLASKEGLAALRKGEDVFLKEAGEDGLDYFFAYVSVSVDSERIGALELAQSSSNLDDYTHHSILRVIVLTGLMVLITWLILLIADMWIIGMRLDQLMEKMERIGSGDFSGDLILHGDDEISDLAQALNRMCKLLSSKEEDNA